MKSFNQESLSYIEKGLDIFWEEAIEGLKKKQKELAPKFFYDKTGSELFDKITDLPEYYPTRTEIFILEKYIKEIVQELGPQIRLVEFGSGSSIKTRVLLSHLEEIHSYIPIDISQKHLEVSIQKLNKRYPDLTINGLCADYANAIFLPPSLDQPRTIVFFPGSSYGNFSPSAGELFLKRTAQMLNQGDGLLIGIDLKKNPKVLHAAYNDKTGITEAFNKNILIRLNRELGTDFPVALYYHYAFYNPVLNRIEMHLISKKDHTVTIGDETIKVKKGESIHTENSYKFTDESFIETAKKCGFDSERIWQDPNKWFSLHYLKVR